MSNQLSTQTISFYGSELITLKVEDVIYTAVKPIVEAMGLDWSGQQQKLSKSGDKFGCRDISMPTNGGLQKMICMPLKKLNGWLFSINPEKVRPDLKDRVIQYQEECFEALYNYWYLGKAEKSQKNNNTASVGSAPLAIEHKKAVEPEKEVKPFTDKELQLLVRVWHHSETMRHWLLKLSDPLKWLNSSYADDAFEAQTFKRDLQDFRFLLIQHCEHIQRHTSSNIHPTAFEQMVYDMRKMCLRINTGREIINPI